MQRNQGIYEKYVKRLLDIICALLVLILFWWLFVILSILVRMKLGSPIVFKQQRSGRNEKNFYMYKFRTMTEEKDSNGNLLPDKVRLTKLGRILRASSMDELLEVFNILKGDMSIIGPRPLLPKDVFYMSSEQRRRHTVRPGLTGLAQCSGRNSLNWDTKLEMDIKYIDHLTFCMDLKIFFRTIYQVLKRQGVTFEEGTDMDLKDWNELKKRKANEKQHEFTGIYNQ